MSIFFSYACPKCSFKNISHWDHSWFFYKCFGMTCEKCGMDLQVARDLKSCLACPKTCNHSIVEGHIFIEKESAATV